MMVENLSLWSVACISILCLVMSFGQSSLQNIVVGIILSLPNSAQISLLDSVSPRLFPTIAEDISRVSLPFTNSAPATSIS